MEALDKSTEVAGLGLASRVRMNPLLVEAVQFSTALSRVQLNEEMKFASKRIV